MPQRLHRHQPTRIVRLHSGTPVLGRHAYAMVKAQRRGNRIVVAATLVRVLDTCTQHHTLQHQIGSEPALDAPQHIDRLLSRSLEWHPDLRMGTLDNGLQYVLLPNKIPPERFEAHLEIHAGSVDENEHEQGVAHLVEHVTFLGSRKREALLGTGTLLLVASENTQLTFNWLL